MGTIIETHDPTLSNFTATSHQLGILKAGPLCLNHSEITTSAETTARSPHRASAGLEGMVPHESGWCTQVVLLPPNLSWQIGKLHSDSAHVVLYITINL